MHRVIATLMNWKLNTQDEIRQELWPGACLHLGSWQRLEMKIRNQYPCGDWCVNMKHCNKYCHDSISAFVHTYVCLYAYVKCMLLMVMLLHIASVHRSKNIYQKRFPCENINNEFSWSMVYACTYVCMSICMWVCTCTHAIDPLFCD